jgi:hypothetical protein
MAKKKRSCSLCGEPGHYKSKCPKKDGEVEFEAKRIDVKEYSWDDHFADAKAESAGPPPVDVGGFAQPTTGPIGSSSTSSDAAPSSKSSGQASASTMPKIPDPATEKACEEIADMCAAVFKQHQKRLAEHGKFHWPDQITDALVKSAIKGRLLASGVDVVDPATREWAVLGLAAGTSVVGEISIRRDKKKEPDIIGAGVVPPSPTEAPVVPLKVVKDEPETSTEPAPESKREPDLDPSELSEFLVRPDTIGNESSRPLY